MTDLAEVEELQLVERARLLDINKEIAYSMQGLVDEEFIVSAGRQLGCQYMLVGDWQRIGSMLRVNARLFETETTKIVASHKGTGEEENIFELQDEIIFSLLDDLNIPISNAEHRLINTKETSSINAYKEYSFGRELVDKGRLEEAKPHVKRAVEIDPSYIKARELSDYLNIPILESFERRTGKSVEELKKDDAKGALVFALGGIALYGGLYLLMPEFVPIEGLVGLVLGTAVLAYIRSKLEWKEREKSDELIPMAGNISLYDLANKHFKRQLKSLKNNSYSALDDRSFRVLSKKPNEIDPNVFVYKVAYDIRPYVMESDPRGGMKPRYMDSSRQVRCYRQFLKNSKWVIVETGCKNLTTGR